MPKQFDLLIFDWDGTLMDSAGVIVDSIQRACEDIGLAAPSDRASRQIIGLGLIQALQTLLPELPADRYPRLVARYPLETRTEDWIAGLQPAAISIQGETDAAGFIHSFTGSHRFVLDYLVEEVLQKQTEGIQSFLLRTSILDRLCGSLCNAVLHNVSAADEGTTGQEAGGQKTLEYLEPLNLFLIPLDSERCWYR